MNDTEKYTHVAGGIVMLPLMFGVLVGAMFQRPAPHMVYFEPAVAFVPVHSAACPWVMNHDFGGIKSVADEGRAYDLRKRKAAAEGPVQPAEAATDVAQIVEAGADSARQEPAAAARGSGHRAA